MPDTESQASTDSDGWVYGNTPTEIAEKSCGNTVPNDAAFQPLNGSEIHQNGVAAGTVPWNGPQSGLGVMDGGLRRRRLVRMRILTKVDGARETTMKFLEMLRRWVFRCCSFFACPSLVLGPSCLASVILPCFFAYLSFETYAQCFRNLLLILCAVVSFFSVFFFFYAVKQQKFALCCLLFAFSIWRAVLSFHVWCSVRSFSIPFFFRKVGRSTWEVVILRVVV